MKAEKLLLPVAGIIAIYFFLTRQSIGMLQYYVKDVSLSMDGITPVLSFIIGVQNPSNESFNIKSLVGNVIVNGQVIGQVSSYSIVKIAPASESDYPLKVRLSLLGVVSDIAQLFQSGGVSKTINFQGYVNANGVVAPINLSYVIA